MIKCNNCKVFVKTRVKVNYNFGREGKCSTRVWCKRCGKVLVK